MSSREDFNLRLENLHKTVKVTTKPSKIQPAATLPKPKAKPSVVKASPLPPQESPAVAELVPEIPDPTPEKVPEQKQPPADPSPKKPVEEPVIDKTLFRKHKVKNTFNTVFPAYGLTLKGEEFVSETKLMSKDLDKAEPVDRTYHMKCDGVKRYTEDMLRAANMRVIKK